MLCFLNLTLILIYVVAITTRCDDTIFWVSHASI